jgi:hypothetical protein
MFCCQIRLGKIRLSANMESDGVMASTMFSSSISTNGKWSEVLVDACSSDETIPEDIWWKVSTFFFYGQSY